MEIKCQLDATEVFITDLIVCSLMEMYFGVKCFFLQVLLCQRAAVVLYNLRLRLLYS